MCLPCVGAVTLKPDFNGEAIKPEKYWPNVNRIPVFAFISCTIVILLLTITTSNI